MLARKTKSPNKIKLIHSAQAARGGNREIMLALRIDQGHSSEIVMSTAPRILEIGDHYLFKRELPRQTTLLWTGFRKPPKSANIAYADCTPRRFLAAMHAIRAGQYDLVVAYANDRSPWHPRYWFRSLAHTPLAPIAALTRVFGTSLLRFYRSASIPLVVLDMHDGFTINASNFAVMDRASVYFKRELPVDNWQTLQATAHPALPTTRIRRHPRWQRRIAKLAPISLQPGVIDIGPSDEIFAKKSFDIFFAGATEANSTVRNAGIGQLKKLAERGIKVDIPSERLDQSAFYQRMSQSWLAWSPSGLGWDCYRHYEAPQCLAVPVINYPTIIRRKPLEHGRHAIYYAPDGDDLSNAIIKALKDKERLKQMALAGREHVQTHHAGPAFCDAVIETAVHLAKTVRSEGSNKQAQPWLRGPL
jgi:glycosyltransferase involved in cell wall biosynthesis